MTRQADKKRREPAAEVTREVGADVTTIYVYLPGEAVDVWRPVEAVPVGESFRIVSKLPDDEQWQFQPGDVVRCETRTLYEGPCLVAVERVDSGT